MKLYFFFQSVRISDSDDPQLYNHVYLFRYLFGRRAFSTRIKSFFNVGIWTYSLRVSLYISDKSKYTIFFFPCYDLLRRADKRFIRMGIFNKLLKIFYIHIADLNIFAEKKTNLGLFYLEQPLNLHIFFAGVDSFSVALLLKNAKLRLC